MKEILMKIIMRYESLSKTTELPQRTKLIRMRTLLQILFSLIKFTQNTTENKAYELQECKTYANLASSTTIIQLADRQKISTVYASLFKPILWFHIYPVLCSMLRNYSQEHLLEVLQTKRSFSG